MYTPSEGSGGPGNTPSWRQRSLSGRSALQLLVLPLTDHNSRVPHLDDVDHLLQQENRGAKDDEQVEERDLLADEGQRHHREVVLHVKEDVEELVAEADEAKHDSVVVVQVEEARATDNLLV